MRVMACESGGNPAAHSLNPATGDDLWGLFQVHRYRDLARSWPTPDKLVDPECNVRWAAAHQRVVGWYNPWGCARKLGIR